MLFIQPDKTISNTVLSGVEGYAVEGALEEKIRTGYPNFNLILDDDNNLIDVQLFEPVPKPITEADIDAQVVARIREQYDINEEYKMLRLGILDTSNADFVAYNSYVEECRTWGQAQKIILVVQE